MFKKLAIAAAAVLATCGAVSAATVFADDFETNALGLNATPNGWTVSSGSVDVIGTGYFQWYGVGRYLDMNGSTGAPGSIQRVISGLVAGATYLLSFDVGYNNYSGNNEQLSFGIGSLSTSYGPTIASGASTFLHLTYAFTASGATETLFFADTGTTRNDNGGAILDNVSISAVPVPAGGLMLVAGLAALAGLRRRKTA